MESLNGTIKPSGNLTGEEIPVIIKEKTVVEKDYENLDNKPSINDVILDGNKTPEELGLTKASDFELYKQSVNHSFRGVSESIQSVKTESKTYTDDTIAAAKAYSDEKNSDLETAINNTINNKNNATRAYASHLVSEERGARETADEETLTASKSYTDTAVVKEVTKGPASSLEFEGLQEGIPFPKIILTVPDEYVYEEGKTVHSINICCNNNADPDATELYSENMLVVAKSNTVEIGYDDAIKLLKQVPGKCIVGFSNEEDAAVCTLTVTGALKYEALKRIYSECWNRMDVEKDNMEGYVRGYTDTEITKCKEYTDEKIAEVSGDITAKGNPVQIDGLQGGVPFSEITMSGKNLLPSTYYSGTHYKDSGVTFDVQSDGSIKITADGTATKSINFHLAVMKQNSMLGMINGNSYRLSGCPTGSGKNTYYISISCWNNTVFKKGIYSYDEPAEMLPTSEYTNYGCAITVCAGVVITEADNVLFRPQLELGNTATEYEPPITGRELTVSACGKNLIPYPYIETTKTASGITWADNGDGSIIANGTSTAQTWFVIFNNVTFNRGTYTLSGNQSGGRLKYDINFIWTDNNGKKHWVIDYGNGITFTLPYHVTVNLLLRVYDKTTVDNLVFRPQLEYGDTATPYEQYHGAEYTITPDSNPYVIPNDIRQQDGLNTISVSEGEISVVGVRKNAALKRVWKEMNDFNAKIGNINTILESVTGGVE